MVIFGKFLKVSHLNLATSSDQHQHNQTNIMNPVTIDFEDAEAIAQNLSEHLQYEEGVDYDFWEAILIRLNQAIRHSQSN